MESIENTGAVPTRLPIQKRYVKSSPRREVLYKKVNVEGKSCWTVVPIRLPSVFCINSSPSPPTYKYWTKGKGDFLYQKGRNNLNQYAKDDSHIRKVSALLRRLGSFNLLDPESTRVGEKDESPFRAKSNRRHPKNVSLSVQTLSMTYKDKDSKSAKEYNSFPLNESSENKEKIKMSTKGHLLHQYRPDINIMSEICGSRHIQWMLNQENHQHPGVIQTERSNLKITQAPSIPREKMSKIPDGVSRSDSGNHYTLTNFNKISVFDNDVKQ